MKFERHLKEIQFFEVLFLNSRLTGEAHQGLSAIEPIVRVDQGLKSSDAETSGPTATGAWK